MTATEQLKHQLDALPPELREVEAARILDELKERMRESHAEEKEAERRARVARAVDGLRRISKRQTLGENLTIRDLIEDGRRM